MPFLNGHPTKSTKYRSRPTSNEQMFISYCNLHKIKLNVLQITLVIRLASHNYIIILLGVVCSKKFNTTVIHSTLNRNICLAPFVHKANMIVFPSDLFSM